MTPDYDEIRPPMLGFLNNYYLRLSLDDRCLDLQALLYRIAAQPGGGARDEITQAGLLPLQQLETHRTNDMERIRRVRLWHSRGGHTPHLSAAIA
jgi:hypothetical protein